MHRLLSASATLLLLSIPIRAAPVAIVAELLAVVEKAATDDTIEIATGTYELSAPLSLGSGVTLIGSRIGKTILTHTDSWRPSTASLPDPELKTKGLDRNAYLIRLPNKTENTSVSGMPSKH